MPFGETAAMQNFEFFLVIHQVLDFRVNCIHGSIEVYYYLVGLWHYISIF